jgi:thymidylate synthase
MTKNIEEQCYLDLVNKCINHGDYRLDRTKIGTFALFGERLVFDLSDNTLPLLTTKFVPSNVVLKELLWILKGQTDSKILHDNGVKIWDLNGSKDFLNSRGFLDRDEGDLGPIYGFQLRHAGAQYVDSKTNYLGKGCDQLREVVQTIKTDPSNRRMIMSSWNVSQLNEMALPPCHCFVQFFVRQKLLDCQLYQRSADLGLGVPFNIASYAFLVHLIASWCDLKPGRFVHTFGDVHVYANHVDALQTQLARQPYKFPTVEFVGTFGLNDLSNLSMDEWCSSFKIVNYVHHPTLKLDMAV